MAEMNRYDKRVRITALLLVCLFFMVVILSIIEFQQGSYKPQLRKLVLDKEWMLTIIAAIGIYVGMWLFHDFRKERTEIKQSARRKKDIASDEDKEIMHKIKIKLYH